MNPEMLQCTAYGCQLTATSHSGGNRWCFMHSKHKDNDIQKMTAEINRRVPLFLGVEAVLRDVSLPEWWNNEVPKRYARPFRDRLDLLPTAAEKKGTLLAWSRRVRATLESEILVAFGGSGKVYVPNPLGEDRPSVLYNPDPELVQAGKLAEDELRKRGLAV